MKIETITSLHDLKKYDVDVSKRQLEKYDNETRRIFYYAPVINDDRLEEYIEYGTVDSIPERYESIDNRIGQAVMYDAKQKSTLSDYDVEMLKERIIEYMETNQDKIFKKNGNYRLNLATEVKKAREYFKK